MAIRGLHKCGWRARSLGDTLGDVRGGGVSVHTASGLGLGSLGLGSDQGGRFGLRFGGGRGGSVRTFLFSYLCCLFFFHCLWLGEGLAWVVWGGGGGWVGWGEGGGGTLFWGGGFVRGQLFGGVLGGVFATDHTKKAPAPAKFSTGGGTSTSDSTQTRL